MDEKLRAIIYARISTTEEDGENLQSETSLDEQIRRCKHWIEYRGHTLTGEAYIDRKSGTTINRPDYAKLMGEDIDTWDIVVAYKLDRFHRNSTNATAWAKELHARDKNFAALDIDVDTSTAMGMGIFKIMTVLSEMEVEVTRERTKMGLRAKQFAGKHIGKPPIGYSSVYRDTKKKEDKGKLVVNPIECSVVEEVYDLDSQGYNMSEIAKHLNKTGVPTRKKGRWKSSVINNILRKRIFYEGKYIDGEGVEQKYEWDSIL
jgi:site-specific DNA recombinase